MHFEEARVLVDVIPPAVEQECEHARAEGQLRVIVSESVNYASQLKVGIAANNLQKD